MPKLIEKFPPLYSAFFPDFMENNYPEERWATCNNCTLCRSPKNPLFDTKCCNYLPHLANYLVGGILQDERPEMAEGKKRVREMIHKKSGVTPYGIIPSRIANENGGISHKDQASEITNQHSETKKVADTVRCPYLNKGNCTIWDYRENLCSTYFCISVGGKVGKDFWKATNNYLKLTENVLSNYALHELGIPASSLNINPIQEVDFKIENKDGSIDEDVYLKLWEGWKGTEEELYIRCYELVAALDKQKFEMLGGHNQVIQAKSMEEQLDLFNNNIISDNLILHPDLTVKKDSLTEWTLSLQGQSVKVNPVVYTYLNRFDGKRTTKEILDLASSIMLNLNLLIDKLVQKKMLISFPANK